MIDTTNRKCPHCGAIGTLRERTNARERFDVCHAKGCGRSSGHVVFEGSPTLPPARPTWRGLTPSRLQELAVALRDHAQEADVDLVDDLKCVARRLEREAKRRDPTRKTPEPAPAPVARTASDIASDLWKLRDEADALAHATAAKAVEEMPAGAQEALREATRALYLGDLDRNALARLVIRALSPELDRVIDERGAKAAFYVARGTAPEEAEERPKIVRRMDTPESRAFWGEKG